MGASGKKPRKPPRHLRKLPTTAEDDWPPVHSGITPAGATEGYGRWARAVIRARDAGRRPNRPDVGVAIAVVAFAAVIVVIFVAQALIRSAL